MTTPKAFSYYDLLEAFSATGCAVCRCLKTDGERYLSALLYEYVNKGQTHQAIRAARGLCNTHSHQLLTTREGMISVAVLYAAAVDEVLTQLDAPNVTAQTVGALGRLLGGGTHEGQAVANRLKPTGECLCCTHLAAYEARYLDVMATELADARFLTAYQASDGVCLPHLVGLLPRIKSPDAVLTHQRAVWEMLKTQLNRYVTRYGMRAEGVSETMGEESDSWRRAIDALAGLDRLFGRDHPPY